MKFSKKLLKESQEQYKGFKTAPAPAKWIEQNLFTHVFPLAKGKKPKDWPAERVMASQIFSASSAWTDPLAIRVIEQNIPKFALHYAFANRLEIQGDSRQFKNLTFRCVWPLLRSLAVNDQDFVSTVIQWDAFPKSGASCYSQAANGLFYCLQKDFKKLKAIVSKADKESRKFFREEQSIAFTKAINTALLGIAEQDPKLVALGLGKAMINGKDSSNYGSAFDTDFRYEVQGLARLAYSIEPELLSQFDAGRVAFWDDELWKWSLDHQPDFKSIDLRHLCKELHEHVVELKIPSWWNFKASKIEPARVPPPPVIDPVYWKQLARKQSHYATFYGEFLAEHEHFLKFHKLPKTTSQPDLAFEWIQAKATQSLVEIYQTHLAVDFDKAIKLQCPKDHPKEFWAIHQWGAKVCTFVDPQRDKELYELRNFPSQREADAYVKQELKLMKDKGFVTMSTSTVPAPAPKTKKTALTVEQKNKQAAVDFMISLGVTKSDAEKTVDRFDPDEAAAEATAFVARRAKERAERKKAEAKAQTLRAKQTKELETELKASKTKQAKTAPPAKTVQAKVPKATKATSQSTERRFEFVEGTSSKFWAIKTSGATVTTTWGKIGTEGQSKTKEFGTDALAKKEYDSLIAEKTKKGYLEKT